MFLKERRKAVLVPIKLRDLVEKYNAPLRQQKISRLNTRTCGRACLLANLQPRWRHSATNKSFERGQSAAFHQQSSALDLM
jgi:hypothetical protein